MYCGQCGKKVIDNMLFCPFYGARFERSGDRGESG